MSPIYSADDDEFVRNSKMMMMRRRNNTFPQREVKSHSLTLLVGGNERMVMSLDSSDNRQIVLVV